MKYTILIVDDQENNRRLMASIISGNTHHNIIIAKNAQDVLEIFGHPDLDALPEGVSI
ncbi:MAG: hypothetical protein JXJ04_20950 [Spirochaetales bacterium]|nr:hypothetical protein [Spirochaetales bacterium]